MSRANEAEAIIYEIAILLRPGYSCSCILSHFTSKATTKTSRQAHIARRWLKLIKEPETADSDAGIMAYLYRGIPPRALQCLMVWRAPVTLEH